MPPNQACSKIHVANPQSEPAQHSRRCPQLPLSETLRRGQITSHSFLNWAPGCSSLYIGHRTNDNTFPRAQAGGGDDTTDRLRLGASNQHAGSDPGSDDKEACASRRGAPAQRSERYGNAGRHCSRNRRSQHNRRRRLRHLTRSKRMAQLHTRLPPPCDVHQTASAPVCLRPRCLMPFSPVLYSQDV